MFENAAFHNTDRTTGVEHLWRAVIAKTLEEWVRGPLRYSRLAEQFLFNDNEDFQAVCSSAGMDPGNLEAAAIHTDARHSKRKQTSASSQPGDNPPQCLEIPFSSAVTERGLLVAPMRRARCRPGRS